MKQYANHLQPDEFLQAQVNLSNTIPKQIAHFPQTERDMLVDGSSICNLIKIRCLLYLFHIFLMAIH